MGETIAVVSGKGGVGKSTISCCLGRAFAQRGLKTVLVELDSGLRGVDIMLGLSNTVYDLDDLLQGRCQIEEAIQQVDDSSLYAICAPVKLQRLPDQEDFMILCSALLTEFDLVLLDAAAGCMMADCIASVASLLLTVVTPDPICVRDAALLTELFRYDLHAEANMRLIINRVNPDLVKKGLIRDLDEVIDTTGVQLIGVLPEDVSLCEATAKGRDLEEKSLLHKVFAAIAGRIFGEENSLIFH